MGVLGGDGLMDCSESPIPTHQGQFRYGTEADGSSVFMQQPLRNICLESRQHEVLKMK